MPNERGQDHERVEVGDAFDRLPPLQNEPVHVGPLDDVAADTCVQPELDEHQVPIATPVVNLTAQIGKATPEAAELCARGLDPDHRCRQWLYQDDVAM